jgi:hypothetical protein
MRLDFICMFVLHMTVYLRQQARYSEASHAYTRCLSSEQHGGRPIAAM